MQELIGSLLQAPSLAIIAIAAPFWLWRADLGAKKIDMTLLGGFQLVNSISESQQGLRILYDGKDLKDPFGSILAISNAGAKPIQSSEFDGPIKIAVAKPARILRSQIVSRDPQSLDPLIFTNDRMITIDPFLLNPGDRMSVEILTTGGKPQFASRGRIAGVPDVKIQEAQSKAILNVEIFGSPIVLDPILGWPFYLFFWFGVACAYFAMFRAFFTGGHSGLVLMLGISSVALLSSTALRFFGAVVFGVSGISLLLIQYAGLAAGVLLYQVAIHLFPVRS